MIVATAVAAMVAAVILHHLGLTERLAQLAAEVATCHQCVTFWLVLLTLIAAGHHDITALLLAAIMAYLSHFTAFALTAAQRLYNKLSEWQRKRPKQTKRK